MNSRTLDFPRLPLKFKKRSFSTITIVLLTIGISLNSFSQNFYFHHSNYSDSSALIQSLPALAKEVVRHYRNQDKQQYLINIIRYHIEAQEYLAAKASIDSLRKLFIGNNVESYTNRIQYESYSLTKELQKNDNRPFNVLYTITLSKLYNNLPEIAKSSLEGYFLFDVGALKKELQVLLAELKTKNSDSITMIDAQALCKTFNLYNMYKHIKPLAKKFMADEDNKKYIIEDSVLIPTRDGAKLSALIARRRNVTTPQPVVLTYDIYAAGESDARIVKKIAAYDYVGVVVNTRGKYLSPQNIEPFEHDASDAYDIIDWISKQPWCNGKIGMYGGSYLGFSQWSATKKIHPALKTIVPQVAVGIGIDYPLHNNVFMSYMLRWIHFVSNNKLTDSQDFDSKRWNELYKNWYISGKSFRSLDSLDGRPNYIFQRWLDHPSYDGFWQNMVPYQEEFNKINIPVLTTTGYFDDDQRGALYYFNQHHQYNKNTNHYLLIGPYDHGGAQSFAQPYLSGYKIDSVANINIHVIVFQWFDHILKGGPIPPILKDKINYQVMGSNVWKHTTSLRNMNNDTLTFYLNNVPTGTHFQLENKKPSKHKYVAQEISYTDRSDATITLPELTIIDSAIRMSNGVTFISQPLEKPIDINGSFLGEIKVTANKKDIDLLVELYELQPDGKYFKLSTYLTRASYTKDRSKRQLLKPGKKETIPINNSYFVSKHLSKGSRIIVLVGMNKKRDWQINYGSGKDVSDETIKDGAVPLKVKWSNESNIRLPVYR